MVLQGILDGTVGNWRTHGSLVSSELFKENVAEVLAESTPVVPVVTASDTTHATLFNSQTRALIFWKEKERKGYGLMLSMMDTTTREAFQRMSGSAAQVALVDDAVIAPSTIANRYITVERGSLRSLHAAYIAQCATTTDSRSQAELLVEVVTGEKGPITKWKDHGPSPVVLVQQRINKNTQLPVDDRLNNSQLRALIVLKLPACLDSFMQDQLRHPRPWALFLTELTEECSQLKYRWASTQDVPPSTGMAAYHTHPEWVGENIYDPNYSVCSEYDQHAQEEWPPWLHEEQHASQYNTTHDPAYAPAPFYCYTCGEQGHLSRDCPRLYPQGGPRAGKGGGKGVAPVRPYGKGKGGKGGRGVGKGMKGKGGGRAGYQHYAYQHPAEPWYDPGPYAEPWEHQPGYASQHTATASGLDLTGIPADLMRAEIMRRADAAAAEDHAGAAVPAPAPAVARGTSNWHVSVQKYAVDIKLSSGDDAVHDASPVVVNASINQAISVTPAATVPAGRLSFLAISGPGLPHFTGFQSLIISMLALAFFLIMVAVCLMVATQYGTSVGAPSPPINSTFAECRDLASTNVGDHIAGLPQSLPLSLTFLPLNVSNGLVIGSGGTDASPVVGGDTTCLDMGFWPSIYEDVYDEDSVLANMGPCKPNGSWYGDGDNGMGCPLEVETDVVVSEVGCGVGGTLSNQVKCVIESTPLSHAPSLDGTLASSPLSHTPNDVDAGAETKPKVVTVHPTTNQGGSMLVLLDSGAETNTFISADITYPDPTTEVLRIMGVNDDAPPLINSTSGWMHLVDKNGSVVHFADKSYSSIKGLPKNLMSVISFAKAGGRVHFQQHEDGQLCKAWANDGSELEVVIIEDLPYIRVQVSPPLAPAHMQCSQHATSKIKPMSLSMLHWILAHSDKAMLKALPNYVDGLSILEGSDASFVCQGNGCKLGKAKHIHFPPNLKPKTTVVGAEVSIDYKSSKCPAILTGNTGFFLYKDRASRFRFMYSTDNKRAETQMGGYLLFSHFLYQYGHIIRHVNFDGGGEFINHTFTKYLDDRWIQWTYTTTDTPQHNSIAERDIGVVSTKSDATQQGMQADDMWWESATSFTTGVDNRVLESGPVKSFPPLEVVTGMRVNLSRYQLPWFCVCFLLRTDRLKSEARRAYPALFVGFPKHQRGILAYVPCLGRNVASVNYTYDTSINTKQLRARVDWNSHQEYFGEEEVDDCLWDIPMAEEAPGPVLGPNPPPSPTPQESTPRRAGVVPSDRHQPLSSTVLSFGDVLGAEDDDHVTTAAPPPGAMAAQGSYWDGETVYEADGSMGAVLADGGMPMGTEMTDGVRSSSRSSNQPARFNPSAPSTSQSFVSISDGLSKDTFVADNVRECKAIDAAAECVDTSEEHYQCNTTYHSFHQWVESRVLSQGDIAVDSTVESVDRYNQFMVHLTQHSTSPLPSVKSLPARLPSLRGTMSDAIRRVVGSEPRGVQRALACPMFGGYWREAMDKEMGQLVENGTYSLKSVSEVAALKKQYPDLVSVMWTHFIFALKTMDDGKGDLVVDKFKGRVVVEGNWMTRLVDFTTSFSPVVSMDTLKLLLALTVIFGLSLTSIDFITAFLQAEVDGQHVYAYMPKGYEVYDKHGNEMCMHLHKNLYGMVQASRMFFMMVRDWLLNPLPLDQGGSGMAWHQFDFDQCCFYTMEDGAFCILFFYVDDVGVASNCEKLRLKVLASIQSRFKVEDKGALKWFLGMMVDYNRDEGKLTLSMNANIMSKIKEFKLQDIKTTETPVKQRQPKGDDGLLNAEEATLYRRMVGCLIWFMLARVDVQQATSDCTQKMQAPTNRDMSMVVRVYAYLLGSMDKLLTFSKDGMKKEVNMGCAYKSSHKSFGLCAGYVDANLDRPRSQTGFAYKMAGGTILSRCKRQPVTAIDTYDSELYGWSLSCCSGIWLWMAFTQLNPLFAYQLCNGPLVCHGDNSSVVRTVQEHSLSTKARHIALRWYHFMQAMIWGVLEAHWISGKYNPANCLSKPPTTTRGFLDEAHDLLGIEIMDKWSHKELPPGWLMDQYQPGGW